MTCIGAIASRRIQLALHSSKHYSFGRVRTSCGHLNPSYGSSMTVREVGKRAAEAMERYDRIRFGGRRPRFTDSMRVWYKRGFPPRGGHEARRRAGVSPSVYLDDSCACTKEDTGLRFAVLWDPFPGGGFSFFSITPHAQASREASVSGGKRWGSRSQGRVPSIHFVRLKRPRSRLHEEAVVQIYNTNSVVCCSSPSPCPCRSSPIRPRTRISAPRTLAQHTPKTTRRRTRTGPGP